MTKLTIFVLVCFLQAFLSAAQAANLCVDHGYTVGFFNGVWNAHDDALDGLGKLSAVVGVEYKDKPLKFQLFYNQTGSTHGASGLEDLLEVFEQRAADLDAHNNLSKHLELFWDSLFADMDTAPLWQALYERFQAVAMMREDIRTAYVTEFIDVIAKILSDPPTQIDYQTHATALDALMTKGQMLLLVAHSQGNLFMNQAYDHVRNRYGADAVQAVHIAPASITLSGAYTLSSNDIVINGLRLTGWNSVPDNNLTIPLSLKDISGHELIATYLDSRRSGRADISAKLNEALATLRPPVTNGHAGLFTVTLSWNGVGDVDLHTVEPSGSHVFYAHQRGLNGRFDVDNVVANGPEHYYASCEEGAIGFGVYHLGINNYARANGRLATVQVASERQGVLATRTLGVGAERGNGGNADPIAVFDVHVVPDGDNGVPKVSVSAN